jgi:succinate-semialdehyde dehydrogenase/glutarate-semialdehyde dehydrogenase
MPTKTQVLKPGDAMPLRDKNLFREQCYVAGQWIDADSGARFPVTNPADGSVLGTVPEMGPAEVRRAVASAAAAFPDWRGRSAKERSAVLRRWFDLCVENRDDLATILTIEQGKPLAESRAEIAHGSAFIEWFSEEARRVYGDVIPANSNDRRIVVVKQPVGVVAAITPWNFPNAMITRKAAAALACGCTVVIKPAESTPYSALALAELAERAGVPPGALNIVTGVPEVIGAELTSNPTVRKLSFTGSTEVGRILLRQCAETVKKVSMELGGNAPFIVFDDADLGKAVAGVVASKFRNAGQTCSCANRIFVQDAIYDRFAAAMRDAVDALIVGNGLDPGVTIGPLIDRTAVEKVVRHIADAVAQGAKIYRGGKSHALGGTFFEPTILTDARPGMKVMAEETFGPVAPLVRFSSEQEVIAAANDTEYGLASYFYTRDLSRAWRVAEALEYGMVGINEGIISTEVAPFGGIKQSGIGREGSKYGVDDYLEIKYVCMGGI